MNKDSSTLFSNIFKVIENIIENARDVLSQAVPQPECLVHQITLKVDHEPAFDTAKVGTQNPFSEPLDQKTLLQIHFLQEEKEVLGQGIEFGRESSCKHISSDPLMNFEKSCSPEAHEDHASPPEEESFLQDNGKSPEVPDVTQPKEKSSGLDKGACSSDDDNDSSFDDSLKYKIWSRGLEMALEDGVFGTISNNPSASSSVPYVVAASSVDPRRREAVSERAWGSAFALVSAEHMVLFKYDLEESGGMETVYFLGLRWMVILWAKF
nr:hypothetical protein Iba_chr07cCG11270 [Ipomoea batatas]